jgi:hypothetical protein
MLRRRASNPHTRPGGGNGRVDARRAGFDQGGELAAHAGLPEFLDVVGNAGLGLAGGIDREEIGNLVLYHNFSKFNLYIFRCYT